MNTIDRVVADVHRYGIGIWPEFLTGTTLKDLQTEAVRLRESEFAIAFPKSTRVWDLYQHGGQFIDLLTDEKLTATVTSLLGENPLLSDYSLNVVNPNQPIDDWHIDYPYNEMPQLVSGSILGLQCVLTLDEFTEENGSTQYIPGSHLNPTRPERQPNYPYSTLQGAPGTLMIMAAATWHRSGQNLSHAPRSGLLLSYVEGWIRPMMEAPSPEGPWSVTEQLRLLLGIQRPPETINGVPISGEME